MNAFLPLKVPHMPNLLWRKLVHGSCWRSYNAPLQQTFGNAQPGVDCSAFWLAVEPTPLKNISQNRNLPQVGVIINKYLKPPPIFFGGFNDFLKQHID